MAVDVTSVSRMGQKQILNKFASDVKQVARVLL